MTIEEIVPLYRCQWIAMEPKDNTIRDLHPDHLGLKVVLHNSNILEFNAALLKTHEYGHSFRLYMTYGGPAFPPDYDLSHTIAAGNMVATELELLQEGVRKCRRCTRLVFPVVTRSGQAAQWARYRLFWDCVCGVSGYSEIGFDWNDADRELISQTRDLERLDHYAIRRSARAAVAAASA